MRDRRKEWEQIIQEQAESGLTGAEFCRRHSLHVQQFYYHKRKQSRSESKSAFLPARVVKGSGGTIEDFQRIAEWREGTAGNSYSRVFGMLGINTWIEIVCGTGFCEIAS